MTLDKVSTAYGNPRLRPEYFLPDYDIAFAIGRSALEAMACGCAAIPIVPQLAGHRITADRLSDWSEVNFSPRYLTYADRFGSAWLAAVIAKWDATDIAQVTAEVSDTFILDSAMDQFEALYSTVIAEHQTGSFETEFSEYLQWLAVEADQM